MNKRTNEKGNKSIDNCPNSRRTVINQTQTFEQRPESSREANNEERNEVIIINEWKVIHSKSTRKQTKQNKTKEEKGGQWWSTLFSSFVLLVTLQTKLEASDVIHLFKQMLWTNNKGRRGRTPESTIKQRIGVNVTYRLHTVVPWIRRRKRSDRDQCIVHRWDKARCKYLSINIELPSDLCDKNVISYVYLQSLPSSQESPE